MGQQRAGRADLDVIGMGADGQGNLDIQSADGTFVQYALSTGLVWTVQTAGNNPAQQLNPDSSTVTSNMIGIIEGSVPGGFPPMTIG